jgi:hypothetical protein
MKKTNLAYLLIVFSGMILSCGPTDSFVEPALCKEFFTKDGMRGDLISNFSVEELLTLEKCGLRYHPPTTFDIEIIRHRDYPVPYLLKQLKGDNEVLNFHIITMLRDLADSGRFTEQLKADKLEIMTTSNDAMSRMKSESLKDQVLGHYQRLEMFYEGIPIAK